MKNKKKKFRVFTVLFITLLLTSAISIPCFAVTKTQTKTGFGSGAAIDATMTFTLSNNIVSKGSVTKVTKNSSFWFCVYNNHAKSAYRYDSNRYYGAHTSGLWADPGEKGGIVNIDVTGFR